MSQVYLTLPPVLLSETLSDLIPLFIAPAFSPSCRSLEPSRKHAQPWPLPTSGSEEPPQYSHSPECGLPAGLWNSSLFPSTRKCYQAKQYSNVYEMVERRWIHEDKRLLQAVTHIQQMIPQWTRRSLQFSTESISLPLSCSKDSCEYVSFPSKQ